MKIGFSPESIVGLDGMPLVGRVTLYAHDSDTEIDVYTLEGDTFVQAANPQLLDNAGRLTATLFFEASIVDVNVEKYIGAEGMMSVDSPDSDFETFDTFETGFDPQELSPRTSVDTIDELMDTAVNNVAVNVVGYYGVGDCVPRTYYWNAESEDTIDGGYVVGSRIVDTGRWILLWNDEQLPSSVYGVIAGVNESNINAFLTYPSVVGSFEQKTAPMPRFEAGNYTTDVALVTTKAVAFDRGAKFPDAPITLKSAHMNGGWSGFVSDFTFTDNAAVAHSSWFKTVDGFLTCGAFEYIVDEENYFESNVLSSRRTLEKKKWVSTSRLPVTYSDSGCIVFNGCAFVGTRFFNSSDIVAFANTVFRDEWFDMTASAFDFDNKITCRSGSLNTLLLANFKSVEVYIKAITANGETSVDLAGRYVNEITTTQFTDLRNVVCNTLSISKPNTNISLHNVKAGTISVSGNFLTIDEGSDVSFGSIPTVTAIDISNSNVSSSVTFNRPLQISARDSVFGITYNEVTDNETQGASFELFNCTLKNTGIQAKHLVMEGCCTEGCVIKIFPYKENGDYKIYARLVGNTFDSSAPVEFTKLDDDECYECLVDWTIVGNSFAGNSEGLKCRFWSNRLGQHSDKPFIKSVYGNNLVYSGNAGNCPAETPKGIYATDSDVNNWQIIELGGNVYKSLCKYSNWSKRVFPRLDTGYGVYWHDCVAVSGDSICFLMRENSAESLGVAKAARIFPISYLYLDDDGSLFDMGLSIYGQVSTATPGQAQIWEYN